MNTKCNSKLILIFGIVVLSITCISCSKQGSMASAQTNAPIQDTNIRNDNVNQDLETTEDLNQNTGLNKSILLKPKIISRKDWNAKEPIGKGKIHKISFITIHHTASPQKPNVSIQRKLQNLQSFSQSKAKLANGKTKPTWFDVPYHYYISVDGKIAEAREIEFAGDTNTDYDPTGHALIVLEGNFEKENPTDEQIESMKKLTAWLANEYQVSKDNIKAHNDYASTACPGVNLKKLLPKTLGFSDSKNNP